MLPIAVCKVDNVHRHQIRVLSIAAITCFQTGIKIPLAHFGREYEQQSLVMLGNTVMVRKENSSFAKSWIVNSWNKACEWSIKTTSRWIKMQHYFWRAVKPIAVNSDIKDNFFKDLNIFALLSLDWMEVMLSIMFSVLLQKGGKSC